MLSAVGRIFTIAFRLLCDPQWLCVHTAIASLCFSLASCSQAFSLRNPWTAYRPRCAASVCLNYSHRDAQPTKGRSDCLQMTLLSTVAVYPQRLHHCFSAWPCDRAFSRSSAR
eukprot:scaffold13247_cov62-Phaeocystis_antarctica.AAC.2